MIYKHMYKPSNISENELYKTYKLFFNTFSSGQRLKILNLLRDKKRNVSEIIEKTGFEQSAVSHNLKRLKSCGFVVQEIKGKYRYYMLNEKTIRPLMKLIDKHMSEFCIHILRGERR